ncbi:MAG: DUF6311 domain-containing protein [Pseudochelatococcus sp.]|uniref:DUF6311 domain-containing protein n=1 Tax=Pseudochelatococcus sp. TaxID=2020869 RepID=UPI003D915E0F
MHSSDDRLSAALSYAFAFILGASICFTVFPLVFLWPEGVAGQALPPDFTQHVVGQRYYIAEPWGWPPLEMTRLNFPDGAHAGFTDSIPLLAMPLKALSFLLPPGFHGFGLWYAVAWIMQPVAAVWCLRAAGERRLLPAACIALIAISMPTWWSRFLHASLCGHFLIWISLGLYFHLSRENGPRYWMIAAIVQIAILFVHPYLWAMTAVFLLAVPLTHLFNGDRRWRSSLPAAALAVLVSIAMAWLSGYFGAHGGRGYGIYGMNLLSPFWPSGSSLLPFDLPMLYTAPEGAWEGYQYLGAGVLAGLLCLVVVRRGRLLADLRRHVGLALVSAFLIVFSLSSTIGIGGFIVADVYATHGFSGFIDSLFDHFRSSGRMFWPVAYLLVLAVVLGLARMRNALLGASLLLAVAVLQFADNRDARATLAQNLRQGGTGWIFDVGRVREAVAGASELKIYPRWECVPTPDIPAEHPIIIQLLAVASETVVPVNTMYVARWHRMRGCGDQAQEAAEPLAPGEARIFGPTVREAYGSRVPDADRYCVKTDPLLVCRRPAD